MLTVTQDTVGGPDVLELREVDRPTPLPGEVVIEVHASSVNPVDCVIRRGDFPLLGEPPFVLGWDVSGVVTATSPAASSVWRPGDEVVGMPLFPRAAAAHAEVVTAPSRQLVRKPASLTHEEAAALPLVGLTAWQALVDSADLQPGQRILVHGGGGGVGHLAIQVAKALGAEVITTASGPKHDWLHDLGADRTIDYRDEDFATVVDDVDVVLDTVGGGTVKPSLDVLRPQGLLVTIIDQWDDDLPAVVAAHDRRLAGIVVEPDHVGLQGLVDLVDQGRLRPHVQEVFPLARIADAHRAVEAGHGTGKIVVSMTA